MVYLRVQEKWKPQSDTTPPLSSLPSPNTAFLRNCLSISRNFPGWSWQPNISIQVSIVLGRSPKLGIGTNQENRSSFWFVELHEPWNFTDLPVYQTSSFCEVCDVVKQPPCRLEMHLHSNTFSMYRNKKTHPCEEEVHVQRKNENVQRLLSSKNLNFAVFFTVFLHGF